MLFCSHLEPLSFSGLLIKFKVGHTGAPAPTSKEVNTQECCQDDQGYVGAHGGLEPIAATLDRLLALSKSLPPHRRSRRSEGVRCT